MKTQKDDKIVNVFTKIKGILSNRKKESSKTYYKGISFNSLLLILAIGTMAVSFYYQYINVFNNSEEVQVVDAYKSLCLYVPLLTMTIVSFINISPKYIDIMKYIAPISIIIGAFINYFSSNTSMLNYVAVAFLGFGFGTLFGFTINLFLYSFDLSERLSLCLVIILLFFSYSFVYNVIEIEFLKTTFPITLFALVTIVAFMINKNIFVNDRKSEIIPKYSVAVLITLLLIICLNQGISSVVQYQTHSKDISNTRTFYSYTYYIGFIISFIMCICIFKYSKNAIMILLIMYFVGLFGAYQLSTFNMLFNPINFANQSFFRRAADVGFGFCTSLGYVLALMMTGKILDDKANKELVFYVILCYICFSISGNFFGLAFRNVNLKVLCFIMMIATTLFALTFIFFNVIGYLKDYNTKDSIKGQIERNQPHYRIINPEEVLTPKEKAVLQLLLEGMTLRQIAGELGMKYDSVNFHYKNIYRKLEVNSKIELILRYGNEQQSN